MYDPNAALLAHIPTEPTAEARFREEWETMKHEPEKKVEPEVGLTTDAAEILAAHLASTAGFVRLG